MLPQVTRYIDPLLDFSFKKIFGSDSSKDLLIDLLNEVFMGRKHIKDLVFSKNEHPGDLKDEAGAIFDVLCICDLGSNFLIEIQRGKQGNFIKRALFYASRQISGQAPKGKGRDWEYSFTDVYIIAILTDFTLAVGTANQVINHIALCDLENGEIFHKEFGFIFIELLNFTKKEEDLETNLDKWLYLLKNISRMDDIPTKFKQPIFERLFHLAEYSQLTKQEKMDYDRVQKYYGDNRNVREYARKEGIEQGIEKGLEQGEHRKALAVASGMKKINLSLDLIVNLTGLTTEEVVAL